MITRGDEQKAVEALSFTQARIYLLYDRYSRSMNSNVWTLMGIDKEWTQVLVLATSHQYPFKRACVGKPVLKQWSLESLNHSLHICIESTFKMITRTDAVHEMMYFLKHPLEIFCELPWVEYIGNKW